MRSTSRVHIFLMAVALLSAFVMPPTLGNAVRKVDWLLTPVSYPVRQVAASFDARLVKSQPTPSGEAAGGATVEQLRDENQTLKFRVKQLTTVNENLQRQLNDVVLLGLPADSLRVVPVTGGDPGNQQVLNIQMPANEAVAPNVPVLYAYGMVGKLEVFGYGAARVRLITDSASRITGNFARYKTDTGEFVALPQLLKTVEGTGDGKMIIRAMKREEVFPPNHPEQALAVGDWVQVSDKDLPGAQGQKLGEIESITESKKPLFVNVTLRPDQELMKLREVMVMVRK